MNWLKRNRIGLFIGALLIAGASTVVFGHSLKVQGGLTCFFWGVGVLILAYSTYIRNQWYLDEFDKDGKEILKDVAINGEDSEYFGIVDVTMINKQRAKLVKKMNKQVVSCAIFGIILLITCILCVI